MRTIDILLVDDHPSVGEGTKNLIEKEPDMRVTFVCSSAEALELLAVRKFDLLMFDLMMPNINGLELLRRVRNMDSDAIVLIYTGYDIIQYFNLLVGAGASGFVSKASAYEQLIMAIRSAFYGDAIIPSSLLRQLRRSEVSPRLLEDHDLEEVTISEKEQVILQEAANGLNNRQIANKLFISQRTVEYHLSRIFDKFRVRSRAEAIREGRRFGLIREENFGTPES